MPSVALSWSPSEDDEIGNFVAVIVQPAMAIDREACVYDSVCGTGEDSSSTSGGWSLSSAGYTVSEDVESIAVGMVINLIWRHRHFKIRSKDLS